jgi:hypothetical protein
MAADGTDLFSQPLGEHTVEWTVWLSEDDLWRRLGTLSQISVLEGQERVDFEDRFREIMRMHDVKRNEKDEVEFHGVTFHVWTKRLD